MATAAQIEANRRNSQKSCGPRTQAGKDKSRFNALDHGCRANILVLPTEVFGDYENQCEAWKLSFRPRNPAEEFLIEGIVSLGCLTRRIDQAETARLNKRMYYGVFEEQATVDAQVIELGQKLFRDACGPQSLHLQDQVRAPEPDGELHRKEILNELTPEERPRYEHYLQMRGYDRLAPQDAAAARLMLLEIVDRAILELEDKAGVFRELEEINLRFAGHRLSWDDTPEGERLRRYGLTCSRTRSRMFDLLLKLRTTADELDIATVASIRRSVPTVTTDAIDQWGQFVADDMTLPDEPDPPIEEPVPPNEANLAQQNAPNEANSDVQAPSQERRDGHKEHRIDTPHFDRKPGGIGVAGKAKSHPVLDRVLGGRNSNLMNLSPIFGGS